MTTGTPDGAWAPVIRLSSASPERTCATCATIPASAISRVMSPDPVPLPASDPQSRTMCPRLLDDHMPAHLIFAFATALVRVEPVQRGRYDTPHSHLVTQVQRGPQRKQLAAAHEARLKTVRAAARNARRAAPPAPPTTASPPPWCMPESADTPRTRQLAVGGAAGRTGPWPPPSSARPRAERGTHVVPPW
ncbi:hypothetical protein [Streptomyces sp. S4.7]|uniref:hypothetical protein n=1 Tax=Streptomyces sp. S4.7 TaxID=2705439 RepID=UPI00193FF644|nr:hypothetical protein [Streptomyces sp. S4.7]